MVFSLFPECKALLLRETGYSALGTETERILDIPRFLPYCI